MSKCLHCKDDSCEPPCGLDVCSWHCVKCYAFEGSCEDLRQSEHKQMRNTLMAQDRERGESIAYLRNKYKLEIKTIFDILKI